MMTRNYSTFLYVVFTILLLGCSTETFTPYFPNPYYSTEYIEANQGQISFEISPVQELLSIVHVLAIGHSMRDSTYQKEVEAYFLDYMSHPIFEFYRQRYTGRSYRTTLITGAYGYHISDGNEISNQSIFPPLNGLTHEFLTYRNVVEDFALQSDFMSFFNGRYLYYQSVIDSQKALMPADQMVDWLEARFSSRYDSHKVVLFPISMGHTSRTFLTDRFTENINFITVNDYNEEYTFPVNKGLSSRRIFTEIDHAYVNPLTNQYVSRIRKAMNSRSAWSENTTGSYESKILIFNEYMTHGLFFLYASDFFKDEELSQIIEIWTAFMVDSRKFIKFDDFKDELLRIYVENSSIAMEPLLLHMIDWMDRQ